MWTRLGGLNVTGSPNWTRLGGLSATSTYQVGTDRYYIRASPNCRKLGDGRLHWEVIPYCRKLLTKLQTIDAVLANYCQLLCMAINVLEYDVFLFHSRLYVVGFSSVFCLLEPSKGSWFGWRIALNHTLPDKFPVAHMAGNFLQNLVMPTVMVVNRMQMALDAPEKYGVVAVGCELMQWYTTIEEEMLPIPVANHALAGSSSQDLINGIFYQVCASISTPYVDVYTPKVIHLLLSKAPISVQWTPGGISESLHLQNTRAARIWASFR